MSFPCYPDYSPSGVHWLGQIPSHWKVVPIKTVAHIVNGYPFDSSLFDPFEGHPLIRIRDINQSTSEAFYKGDFIDGAGITSADVIIGMDGDFNVGRWRGDGRALLNQRLCCLRGQTELVTRLLEYALPVPLKIVNDLTYSTTVKHLSSGQVGRIKVAIPPERELRGILAFLDKETSKIDVLIAEQEKLLALLAEKRQATISRAVTRGLNSDVPMKDSGVAWLGEVPVHWRVGALSYVARIETGSTPDRGRLDFWDGSIPWIKTGEINWTPIRGTEEHITEAAIENSSVKIAKPGTLMMAMYGQGATRGRVALLEIEATYNQACAAISFEPCIAAAYARYFFTAAYDHVREGGNETSQMNLGAGIISKFKIPIPPVHEQLCIASYLDAQIASIVALETEAKRGINLLRERRGALITAAVTGKIDVRTVVREELAA